MLDEPIADKRALCAALRRLQAACADLATELELWEPEPSTPPPASRHEGTIAMAHPRGFGFITSIPPGIMDTFFHASVLQGVLWEDLQCGDRVCYTLDRPQEDGRRRAKAVWLREAAPRRGPHMALVEMRANEAQRRRPVAPRKSWSVGMKG